jgi:methyl-accepting chemotaxis protein
LFDQEYQPFGDTEPPKYHTRFDAVADRILPRLQEHFANEAPSLAYAIACDHNGYVPTHNQRYCEALTGDPAHDKVYNRTKRIFSDPVGVRCGRHPLPYLLQTYRRDTGEIMHDISAPIYVQGRHWGGFRIGYKTVLV